MNQHETITSDIHRTVDDLGDIEIITPSAIADALIERYAGKDANLYLVWAGREHFKQMARQVLASKFDITAADLSDTTGELFSDKLQKRYPVPAGADGEKSYKSLEALTEYEVAWNVQRMERASRTLQAHARTLKAWGLRRFKAEDAA